GKFWEMHDKLYENQTQWTPAKDLVPIFVDYAKQIGIDPDRFMKDLNGEQVAQRIFQDGKRVHALGLSGTPSFFVNGQEAKGDQWKPDGLRQMIKDTIAASGKRFLTVFQHRYVRDYLAGWFDDQFAIGGDVFTFNRHLFTTRHLYRQVIEEALCVER